MKLTTHLDLNADVKNEQSYTSPFRYGYAFMACTKDNFIFTVCLCLEDH